MSPNPEKASMALGLELRKTDFIHWISVQKKEEHTLKIPERKTGCKKKKVKGKLS